jgi:phosphoglycolate phosphatase
MIDYFHQIVARDDVELPKPNPYHLLHTINLLKVTPEKVLYVGDTTTDLETAEAAGVEFLGYWRDTERAKRLVEAGGKKLIKDLREIVKIANKYTSLDGN